MTLQFALINPAVLAAVFFVLGAIAGGLANLWAIALTPASELSSAAEQNARGSSPWYQLIPLVGCLFSLGNSRFRGARVGWRGLAIEVSTGLLFAAYVLAAVPFECQQISEVRPDDLSKSIRILDHLVLITLLVAATVTDFRDYVIPDQITIPGALFGVCAAALSGQLQIVHVWVDWNQEIPGIVGPFIPAWLDAHRHWHGLAWSATGGAVGAGLTASVRGLSGLILGREALGFGDVTLMAMIGTFLGWQPIVFVFLLAPLCGLVGMFPLRRLTKRSYLPYGPFLAAAAIVVLFAWRWLWLSTRLVFGHPLSLAILCGTAAVTFVALLGMLRFYQSRA